MSRIGKKPIQIPANVDVTVAGQAVTVKGPKGTLSLAVHPHVSVAVEAGASGKAAVVKVAEEENVFDRALWGTTRANIANMILGVTDGFSKSLELNGVGYRVSLSGKKLVFVLGFSHDIQFPIPEGMSAEVEKNIITLRGIDRQLVGETAARIRQLKKPEPYLGKGIKYVDETIRRKAGKAAKASE